MTVTQCKVNILTGTFESLILKVVFFRYNNQQRYRDDNRGNEFELQVRRDHVEEAPISSDIRENPLKRPESKESLSSRSDRYVNFYLLIVFLHF